MLKKYFYIATILAMAAPGTATAASACTAKETTYSCFAGYYLDGTNCERCPMVSQNRLGQRQYGTSPDHNTGGVESCYAEKNSEFTDFSGTFMFTENCQYTN